MEVEGWTHEHDDGHSFGQLAEAAACYCIPRLRKTLWPWDESWWNPKSRKRNLVRAGALIAAELDRMNRARKEAVR